MPHHHQGHHRQHVLHVNIVQIECSHLTGNRELAGGVRPACTLPGPASCSAHAAGPTNLSCTSEPISLPLPPRSPRSQAVTPLAHPSSLLGDPLGDAVVQHELRHVAGDAAEEACYAVLVDVDGHAVAEAQQRDHPAPVNAAFKQAETKPIGLVKSPPKTAEAGWPP